MCQAGGALPVRKVTDANGRTSPSHLQDMGPRDEAVLGKRPPRSSRELRLVVLAVLLATAAVALLAAVTLLAAYRERDTGADYCLTEACVKTAARILDSLDTAAQPCEDFYQFACGGWLRRNPIPESQTSWDQFRSLREQLLRDLKDILEEKSTPDEPGPVQQAKALYRTCLDTGELERLGLEPLVATLKKLNLSTTLPTKGLANQDEGIGGGGGEFDWLYTAARAQRMLGHSVLLGFWVNEDVRNTSRNLMVVDQISPGFSERYLLDPERFGGELAEYRRYITDIVRVFLQRTNQAAPNGTAENFAEDVLSFSTQLAGIMTTAEQRRDVKSQFHEMTVAQLQEHTDAGGGSGAKLNWTRYVSLVLQETNVTLDFDTDTIVLMDSSYFHKLALLIGSTNHTTLERFVWWNIFSSLAPLTLQEFRDLGFRFTQKVFGLTEKTPRWKRCTSNVNTNFGMAVSYLYVQKHFNDRSRKKALEMVQDIEAAFTDIVAELQWMDMETKNRTLDKVRAMRPFIGFPGWLLTPGQLEQYFQGAEVAEGKLFETYLKLIGSSMKKSLEDLRKAPDHDRWVTAATTVNAFYSPVLNSVTFPAGILQPPFYGLGLEALNYGAIGSIMGHELTHGFDDQGRRYDKNGNLQQWWTESTLQEYHNRVQCIVQQYGRYHVPQLGHNFTVNGINTQGENIADNGGLREAWRAYRRFLDRQRGKPQQPQMEITKQDSQFSTSNHTQNGTENSDIKAKVQGKVARVRHDEQPPQQHGTVRLPGLSQYSPEQLFFVGFAHMWCGHSTPGALKSKLVEGVHSPNRFRVVGTLSNSKEFSEAWNCPKGSPMNPQEKCILW